MSFQNRLLLLILAVTVIPNVAVGIVGFYYGQREMSKYITDRLVTINRQEAIQVESIIDDFRLATDQLSKDQTIVTAAQKLVSASANLKSGEYAAAAQVMNQLTDGELAAHNLDDVKIVSNSGNVVYVNNDKYLDQLDTKGPAELAQAAHSGGSGLKISNPIKDIDRIEDVYEIFLSAPLYNNDRQVVGVIVVEAELDELFDVLNNYGGYSPSGETLLGYNDGFSAVLFSPLKYASQTDARRRIDLKGTKGQGIIWAIQGQTGYGNNIDYRGVPTYSAWTALADVNWGIVTKIDQSEVLSVLNKVGLFLGLGIPVVVIFMIFSTIWLFSRFIRRPLRHLIKVSEELSNGHYDAMIDQKMLYTPGDFGKLATYIHHISHRLRYEQQHETKKPVANIPPEEVHR